VRLLNGHIASFERDAMRIIMHFVVTSASLDNGNGQVMGGFLAAMMDVTVAQAAVVASRLKQTVSTLEQKVSFLAPVKVPRREDEAVLLVCAATAVKSGKRVAFYEVSLTNEATDTLVARATQTTLLVNIRRSKKKENKANTVQDTRSKL